MANVTLACEFATLGTAWQTAYPWNADGCTFGDSAWMGVPGYLTTGADPIAFDNGIVALSDFARPSEVDIGLVGGQPRIG